MTSDGETYASLESKTNQEFSAEDQINHLWQRIRTSQLVLKELQQELALYKKRCTGVDTVALMLKESKQEVVKLTRQRKALETAVANLQNRLSINNLSSSVNIEETELFVPGASKQTLDNLARENARLRSLLKNAETQSEKRPSEDLQNLVETLESDNSQLKAQLMEMEGLKLQITKQYEEAIEEMKTKNLKLEQDLSRFSHKGSQPPSRDNEDNSDSDTISVACQTVEVGPSKIEELKSRLKQMSNECLQLYQDLEQSAHLSDNKSSDVDSGFVVDKISKINEKAYEDLQSKLNQVIMMNQRWQSHNDQQEMQIRSLSAKISELEETNQDAEMWKNEAMRKDVEVQRLSNIIENLQHEITRLKSRPQDDHSIVEILKQQIQVCTEDFNTERKDREQAVGRAKQLHDELNKLSKENETLKKELEQAKKPKSPIEAQLDRRLPQQISPLVNTQFRARGAQPPPQRITYNIQSSQVPTFSTSTMSPPSSMSPVVHPSSVSGSKYSGYLSSASSSGSQEQGPRHIVHNQPLSGHDSDYMSMPRSSHGLVNVSPSIGVSMPTLSRRSASSSSTDKGQYLTCPRCNKGFLEEQNEELMKHIESCTE